MSKFPVETLIRPLVELPSAAVSLTAAVAIGVAPDVFWVTASVQQAGDWWRVLPIGHMAMVTALAFIGFRRLSQAYGIARYQASLKAQPYYAVKSAEIPFRSDALFLGTGFRWDDRHTRRLTEANRAASKPYLKRNWTDTLLRTPIAVDDGVTALHGVGSLEGNDEDVWLTDIQRMGHVLVLGTTGVGKTRICELLVSQDIRRGGPVIVLDPKGDKDLMLQMYATAIACGRVNDFQCFHLGFPQFSARYNPFGNFARVTEIASRIRESVPDTGNSAVFADFVWSYVNTIAVTLHALGRRTTISALLTHATNMDELVSTYMTQLLTAKHPNWAEDLAAEVQTVPDRLKKGLIPRAYADRDVRTVGLILLAQRFTLLDDVGQRLLKTFGYDRSYQDKLVGSLFPLLQKMSTGAIADILSPDYDNVDDPRPMLDFDTAIRTNKIVYIGLDALTDATVAKAVGSSMFADLTSIAGRIYNNSRDQGLSEGVKRTSLRWRVHADEFNESIGESFVPLLNKARGAGLDVTAYTQSRADITVGMGDADKGRQVEDNFNTIIMMRVRSDATAQMLTDQLPDVMVPSIIWGSATTDGQSGTDFTSSQTQRITETAVPMITSADLSGLPRGHAFIAAKGGHIYKVRFPLPVAENKTITIEQMAKALIAVKPSNDQMPWTESESTWRNRESA